jgi:hypothetical protein
MRPFSRHGGTSRRTRSSSALLDPGRKRCEVLKAPYGKVLKDAGVRLDGEDIEADARYQV